MSGTTAAGSEIVRRLARGSLLGRLASKRQPLKLLAVPRDHVAGDRQRGAHILAGKLPVGNAMLPLGEIDFASVPPLSSAGARSSRARASPSRTSTRSR